MESNAQCTSNKNHLRTIGWHWLALPGFSLCRCTNDLAGFASKSDHAKGHHPGSAFRRGLSRRILCARHALEALPESYRKSEHTQSHPALSRWHLSELLTASTRRRSGQEHHVEAHCQHSCQQIIAHCRYG